MTTYSLYTIVINYLFTFFVSLFISVLPDPRTLSLLMQHPLSCQTAFHEIMCGIWVRNGVQIKGQAMTYIQCHFCKSMVDADIFLLQMCATHLHPEFFLEIVLDRFKIKDWLSLSSDTGHLPTRVYRDNEQKTQMIESALFFLVTILSNRINLGISEEELARFVQFKIYIFFMI